MVEKILKEIAEGKIEVADRDRYILTYPLGLHLQAGYAGERTHGSNDIWYV
jgi:hypothetical protein